MLYWMGNDDNNSAAEWLNLERTSVISISLKALLCFKLPSKQPIYNFTSNPIALHSDLEPV